MPEFPFFTFKVTLEGSDAELFPNHQFLQPVMHRIENIYHLDPDRLYPDRAYPRNVSKPCLQQHPVMRLVHAVAQFTKQSNDNTISAEVWIISPWNKHTLNNYITDQKIFAVTLTSELWLSSEPHEVASQLIKDAVQKFRSARQFPSNKALANEPNKTRILS